MEKNEIYYDFKDVRERDMDFMMMEEFCASQGFADLFLDKVGKAGAEVVRVYHSKYEKHMGESDMIVVCVWQGKRHALLIEDKIDADAMTRNEIFELWRENRDISWGEPLSLSSFKRYRDACFTLFKVDIKCDKHNRYYIHNEHEFRRDNVHQWMLQSLSLSTVLRNSNIMTIS